MSSITQIGNGAGLSFLAVQVLEVIVAAGCLLPPAKLARDFRVEPTKIRDIIQDPAFQNAYHTVVLGKYYFKLDEVLKKITDQAIEGKAAQQKIFLQLHGLIDNKGVNHITANQFNLGQSPEEIIARRKELETVLVTQIRNESGGAPRSELEFEGDKPTVIIDTDSNEVISDKGI